nr:PREDICTED: uncharacterized protein LOC106705011 [Latimeria chalumnae]|eukprot:XP_014348828.1 PREDICTED: uncharacterized protein LOC106705011 [Latimeria chalumnae]
MPHGGDRVQRKPQSKGERNLKQDADSCFAHKEKKQCVSFIDELPDKLESPVLQKLTKCNSSPRSALCTVSRAKFALLEGCAVTSAKNPIKSSSVYRPVTVCQTSVSSLSSALVSSFPSARCEAGSGRHRVFHRAAWYHVPGRYPTLQHPVPPKRHQVRREAYVSVAITGDEDQDITVNT